MKHKVKYINRDKTHCNRSVDLPLAIRKDELTLMQEAQQSLINGGRKEVQNTHRAPTKKETEMVFTLNKRVSGARFEIALAHLQNAICLGNKVLKAVDLPGVEVAIVRLILCSDYLTEALEALKGHKKYDTSYDPRHCNALAGAEVIICQLYKMYSFRSHEAARDAGREWVKPQELEDIKLIKEQYEREQIDYKDPDGWRDNRR